MTACELRTIETRARRQYSAVCACGWISATATKYVIALAYYDTHAKLMNPLRVPSTTDHYLIEGRALTALTDIAAMLRGDTRPNADREAAQLIEHVVVTARALPATETAVMHTVHAVAHERSTHSRSKRG